MGCICTGIQEGAHGVVYRAVDTSKGMWFAVKHLKLDGDEGAKLFQRELQALRQFRHPHIIRLFGICGHATSGRMHLAFEYATHGSVEDWLKDDSLAKIWPFGRRLQTATGVAQALNYMYRALGKICLHRDVKSANIVLCQGMGWAVCQGQDRRSRYDAVSCHMYWVEWSGGCFSWKPLSTPMPLCAPNPFYVRSFGA